MVLECVRTSPESIICFKNTNYGDLQCKLLNFFLKCAVLSSLNILYNCHFLPLCLCSVCLFHWDAVLRPPISRIQFNSSFFMKRSLISSKESDTPNTFSPPSLCIENIASLLLIFVPFYLILNVCINAYMAFLLLSSPAGCKNLINSCCI